MKINGFRASEELEREKLLASGSMADVTPQDLLQPHSDFHIRNRYLSRIGANVSLIFYTFTIKYELNIYISASISFFSYFEQWRSYYGAVARGTRNIWRNIRKNEIKICKNICINFFFDFLDFL